MSLQQGAVKFNGGDGLYALGSVQHRPGLIDLYCFFPLHFNSERNNHRFFSGSFPEYLPGFNPQGFVESFNISFVGKRSLPGDFSYSFFRFSRYFHVVRLINESPESQFRFTNLNTGYAVKLQNYDNQAPERQVPSFLEYYFIDFIKEFLINEPAV